MRFTINSSPGNILVVDDCRPIRRITAHALRREGYSVDTAPDGRISLEKILAGEYDLVITDVGMSNMSGADLVARIKQILCWPKIIVMTANTHSEEVQQIQKMGVRYIIPKPFDIHELLLVKLLLSP